MFKKFLISIAICLTALVCVLLFNTFRSSGDTVSTAEVSAPKVDAERAIANLSKAIQFKTVSKKDKSKIDRSQFLGFLKWMEQTYPNVHSKLELKLINGLTPLFKWEGKDTSLNSILLTGHYDVVPSNPNSLKDWDEPPFSGLVKDGFVWGRGTLDDKIAVIGILEAIETLIAEDFQPQKTIYLSFGHDEEILGDLGAFAVVKYFKKNNIKIDWSLDEGSMVLKGIIPAIKKPIASINVAEKGYITLNLIAKAAGGHSSLPPKETAVGILAGAITKLRDNPVPGGLTDVTGEFFDRLGPSFPFVERMLFANRWLFAPILESQLSKSSATNAVMRTTTAPTMLSGSVQENVLPREAIATVNFRLHPRDTSKSLIEFVKSTVNDKRVDVEIVGKFDEPSVVSDHEADGYNEIATSIIGVFGDVVTVPGLTIAATDSRLYSKVVKNSYRINPIVFEKEDIPRIHGINERISTENVEKAVQFYQLLISRQ